MIMMAMKIIYLIEFDGFGLFTARFSSIKSSRCSSRMIRMMIIIFIYGVMMMVVREGGLGWLW